MRSEFPRKTLREAFARAEGRCEWKWTGDNGEVQRCNLKLYPGNLEYDHIVSCEMGGDNSLENCQALCKTHHRWKTKGDMKTIAKARRVSDRHIGIKVRKGRPIPGSRGSGLRKKMSGVVVHDPKW